MRYLNAALLPVIPILLIAAVILAFWGYDVWKDRRHVVSVLADTPVYVGHGNESCSGNKLTTVHGGTRLPVRRIRYWKNCATVDVGLPDGSSGHIVFGDGSVSVTPPLND